MKHDLTSAFIKDVKKSPLEVQSKVKALIASIAADQRLADLLDVKKLKGFSDAYRIRFGEYRVGIVIRDGVLILVRILHRREIYR